MILAMECAVLCIVFALIILPAPQKIVTEEGEEWVMRNTGILIDNFEEDRFVFIWESLESQRIEAEGNTTK